MTVVAVDPGKRAAWACIGEHGLTFDTFDGDEGISFQYHDAWQVTTRYIIELPSFEGKASVRDISKLAYRAGKVAGMNNRVSWKTVFPEEWKGSVPKPIHHKRIEKEFKKRWPRALWPSDPNVRDAIGLAMWYEKQLNSGRPL